MLIPAEAVCARPPLDDYASFVFTRVMQLAPGRRCRLIPRGCVEGADPEVESVYRPAGIPGIVRRGLGRLALRRRVLCLIARSRRADQRQGGGEDQGCLSFMIDSTAEGSIG